MAGFVPYAAVTAMDVALEWNELIATAEDGATVTLTGYMPEGSQVQLKSVSEEQKLEIMAQVEQNNFVFAYDITILDGDGIEWQPDLLGINVNISGIEMPESTLEVVHVPDNGEPEYIEKSVDGDTVEFKSYAFSIYAGLSNAYNVKHYSRSGTLIGNTNGYSSLALAINDGYTATGDRFVILNNYTETFTSIKPTITLFECTIDGNNKTITLSRSDDAAFRDFPLFNVVHGTVTIKNCTFNCSGVEGAKNSSGKPIIYSYTNAIFNMNNEMDPTESSLRANFNLTNVTIQNQKALLSAIKVTKGSVLTVNGSTFTSNKIAIYADTSTSAYEKTLSINNSTFSYNTTGLQIKPVITNFTLSGNTFSGNTNAIMVGSGIGTTLNVSSCTFSSNKSTGLYQSGMKFNSCTFDGNTRSSNAQTVYKTVGSYTEDVEFYGCTFKLNSDIDQTVLSGCKKIYFNGTTKIDADQGIYLNGASAYVYRSQYGLQEATSGGNPNLTIGLIATPETIGRTLAQYPDGSQRTNDSGDPGYISDRYVYLVPACGTDTNGAALNDTTNNKLVTLQPRTTVIYIDPVNGNDTTNTGITSSEPVKTFYTAYSRLNSYGIGTDCSFSIMNTVVIPFGTITMNTSSYNNNSGSTVNLHGDATGEGKVRLKQIVRYSTTDDENPNTMICLNSTSGTLSITDLTLDGKSNKTGSTATSGIIDACKNVTLSNCIVKDNTSTDFYGFDSALRQTAGTLTLTGYSLGGSFAGTKVINCNGNAHAGIIVEGTANLVVENGCQFTNNHATSSTSLGGALYVAGSGQVTIKDSTFRNNSAYGGGAVFLNTSNNNNFFENDDIYDNSATANGGALHVDSGCVEIRSCRIKRNTASYGGGIYASNTTITLTAASTNPSDTEIYSNQAFNTGGGLYIQESTFVAVDGSVKYKFMDNTASCGGGLAFHSAATAITVNDLLVMNNKATGSSDKTGYGNFGQPGMGGGIAVGNDKKTSQTSLTLGASCKVQNNQADTLGDDLYSSGLAGMGGVAVDLSAVDTFRANSSIDTYCWYEDYRNSDSGYKFGTNLATAERYNNATTPVPVPWKTSYSTKYLALHTDEVPAVVALDLHYFGNLYAIDEPTVKYNTSCEFNLDTQAMDATQKPTTATSAAIIAAVSGGSFTLTNNVTIPYPFTTDKISAVDSVKTTAGSIYANSTIGFGVIDSTKKEYDLDLTNPPTIKVSSAKPYALTFNIHNANALTVDDELKRQSYTFVYEFTDTTGNKLTFHLTVQRKASMIKATVPLVIIVRTNINGGSYSFPSNSSYYIDNNSSMRIQVVSATETTYNSSILARSTSGGSIVNQLDKYRIIFNQVPSATNPVDLLAEGESNSTSSEFWRPLKSIEISPLTFYTKDPDTYEKGVLFSRIQYTLQIP